MRATARSPTPPRRRSWPAQGSFSPHSPATDRGRGFTLSPPRPPLDALTEETLGLFLDAFYAKVRLDPVIGPVFAARIADGDWPRHLATIRDFWCSVLLKTGRYKGNPFGKHLAIGGLGLAHFECWLGLFSETAAESFVPEIAVILSERANRIGDSLKAGLFFRPEVLNPASAE